MRMVSLQTMLLHESGSSSIAKICFAGAHEDHFDVSICSVFGFSLPVFRREISLNE